MKHLIAILAVSLSLVGFATAIWSWPGQAALLALAPGIIVGSVLKHLVDAWLGQTEPRLAFVVLGILMGVFSSFVALLFMGAASAPVQVQLEAEARLPFTDSLLEEEIRQPLHWANWSHWLGGMEGTEDIHQYRSTLVIGGNHVPALCGLDTSRWDEDVMRWNVTLPEGSGMGEITEELHWRGEEEHVNVRYTLRYALPTLTGRALHALMFQRSLRVHVDETIRGLTQALEERNRDL